MLFRRVSTVTVIRRRKWHSSGQKLFLWQGFCHDHSSSVNTLKLLIELRAPLKKPASETTYFELLVLAFRVFEFQRSKVENSEEV